MTPARTFATALGMIAGLAALQVALFHIVLWVLTALFAVIWP